MFTMQQRLEAHKATERYRTPSPEELAELEHVEAEWTAGTAPTTYLWTGTSSCPFCGYGHLECWKWAPRHTKVTCQRCGNPYVTDAVGWRG